METTSERSTNEDARILSNPLSSPRLSRFSAELALEVVSPKFELNSSTMNPEALFETSRVPFERTTFSA